MKALTISQHPAHLVVTGRKRLENRPWTTQYRGPIAILAGTDLAQDPRDAGSQPGQDDHRIFGAIVGVAELVDVLPIERVRAGHFEHLHPGLATHPLVTGPWCWVLDKVQRIVPVACSGQPGLWTLGQSLQEVVSLAINAEGQHDTARAAHG